MQEISRSAVFYNALAVEHHGSYHALHRLLETHGDWETAFEKTRHRNSPDPLREEQRLTKHSIRLLLADDPAFPELLREIPWAPHGIYLRGSTPQPTTRIAVVGTRKASPFGISFARQMSTELSRSGITIVSGLALGIDAAAHEGVVDCKGIGIAVLASGLDTVTPRTNTRLAERLLEHGGSLISEYPPGTESLPRLFLERNRIVSGLSKGIVVIEAPKRSGTLATARFAIEQNREVFVVPGAVNHPNYEGSNELIKQGASLITSAPDILKGLGLDAPRAATSAALPFLDALQQKIVQYLTRSGEAVHTDALSDGLHESVSTLNEALAMLTVLDIVKEDGGKYYV